MKVLTMFAALALFASSMIAQSDLQKLVDTENAFANAAAEKGNKAAFLEYLSSDSIVFNPQRANGREVWSARKESPALLSWYPVFADISNNGLVGYTTGPWEYRPKGKDDKPTAFGHYMTVWQKQPDGNFKAVLDIGVLHDKSLDAESKLGVVNRPPATDLRVTSSAGDTAANFFETITSAGAEKAYKVYAADDIRLMRDGRMPIIGKRPALKAIGDLKGDLFVKKRMSFFGSDDIAYATNTYSLKKAGTIVETGNLVQVWKNRRGRWQIVMDVFVADEK